MVDTPTHTGRPCVVVARDHETLLHVLRERGRRGQSLFHVDQHCDMRGWLVDPLQARGCWLYGGDRPDSGNVLGHAISEGWVNRVVWLYGDDGGRENDFGTFLYFEEARAWPWSWLARGAPSWTPMEMQHFPASRATYPAEVDILGLDWDYFASFPSTEAHTQDRITHFLSLVSAARAPFPELIYICSSPGYSSAHLQLFDEFARELARLQGGELRRLEAPWSTATGSGPIGRMLAAARYAARLPAVAMKSLAGGKSRQL